MDLEIDAFPWPTVVLAFWKYLYKIVVSGDTSSLKDEIVRLTHLSSAGNFGDDQISHWVTQGPTAVGFHMVILPPISTADSSNSRSQQKGVLAEVALCGAVASLRFVSWHGESNSLWDGKRSEVHKRKPIET